MKIIIMFLFVDDLIFGLGVVNICLYFLILNVIFLYIFELKYLRKYVLY